MLFKVDMTVKIPCWDIPPTSLRILNNEKSLFAAITA